MADIALIYRFGHAEMCAMSLPELARWRARARAQAEDR
jgi:hypothetical protein